MLRKGIGAALERDPSKYVRTGRANRVLSLATYQQADKGAGR